MKKRIMQIRLLHTDNYFNNNRFLLIVTLHIRRILSSSLTSFRLDTTSFCAFNIKKSVREGMRYLHSL